MRIALILFLLPLLSVGQTPCEDGFSAGFPCNRFEFLSQLTLQDLSAGYANDSWGWTDPDSGKEYALVGLNNGTAFVDITDPVNPLLLGKLPTHTDNSTWRDVKVYAKNMDFRLKDLRQYSSLLLPYKMDQFIAKSLKLYYFTT